MKHIVQNYTFSSAAGTITFNDFSFIKLENVLLITNVTDQEIIYNFADATQGGTIATNVLTLEYDTTTMSNTDALQIYYWIEGIATFLDEVGNDTYIGKAIPSTATSEAKWQISRLRESGTETRLLYADGNDSFDNIWDDRLILSYS